MKMKNGLIGLAVVMGLFLAACNSGGGSTAPIASGDLIGKWFYRKAVTKGTIKTSFTIGTQKYDTTEVLDTTATYTGSVNYIEFKSDNTYNSNRPDNPGIGAPKASAVAALENGTWTTSGSTLTLVSSANVTTKIDQVAVSGNDLTGTLNVDTTATSGGFSYSAKLAINLTLSK
ncbi:MAG: hypothetical protein JWO30_3098 [Fibrobacteres bacterium]|nr:hypothetical protein [Fibrobacterota bacterium]